MATNCSCDTFAGNLTVLGSLGIGTASPQTNLNIAGSNASLRVGSTPQAGLDYNDGSGDLYVGGNNAQDGDVYVKDHNGTIRVSIRAETGIQINRTESQSGNNQLYFQDNGQIRSFDDSHRLIFDRANNILELREFGSIVFSPGATSGARTQVMTLTSGGNVGIGTTNPTQQLHITGNLQCNGLLVSSNILLNGALQNSLAQNLVDAGGCYYAS